MFVLYLYFLHISIILFDINLCFPFVVTGSISNIYPFISLFVPGGSCHGGNHMIVGFASTLNQQSVSFMIKA